ncbi:hypothetical protein QWY77_04360 [Thalassotalea ponticola]|uniref:hypothetical protein n=1 Tax=Thalassotalea ponticola TaxID=1523392 RepID=UPI0025B58203|nr:hypothetical protein [Thalassotalea ponticola]MDN3651999.1 hypothetical protein [Thalassotalea ponticola]
MQIARHIILTVLLVLASAGHANEIAWQEVGKAKLEVLFWDVYKARLYTESGTFNGIKGPLKLDLTYYLDIKGEDLAKETAKQWRKMGFRHPDNKAWIADLYRIFPNLQKGDSLTLILSQQNQGSLLFNGERIHQFEPSIQLNQFLAIWLSEQSTRPELMAKLTGKS